VSSPPKTSASASASVSAAPLADAGHRARLIAAMAASIEEKGYRSTSVADVVRIARTSRRTFYEHFDDRDACFLALFEATVGAMMGEIAGAVRADAGWETLIDGAVGAYLESVAARPALFQSFTHEMPGLGRAGIERGRRVAERFADVLVELAESARREHPDLLVRPLDHDTAIIIVGGLRELIVSAVEKQRDVSELRASASEAVRAIVRAALLEPEHAASTVG
jgi:AcrR family transcriptional regulator